MAILGQHVWHGQVMQQHTMALAKAMNMMRWATGRPTYMVCASHYYYVIYYQMIIMALCTPASSISRPYWQLSDSQHLYALCSLTLGQMITNHDVLTLIHSTKAIPWLSMQATNRHAILRILLLCNSYIRKTAPLWKCCRNKIPYHNMPQPTLPLILKITFHISTTWAGI